VPQIVTLPGTRPGPDNVFAQQNLTSTATTEIAAGTRIYSSLFRTYWTNESGASIVNHGEIWNIAPGNVGAVIAGYYAAAIENFGLIVSEAPNGNAEAIWVGTGGALVNNVGQIYAIANGNATAITHWDPDVLLVNRGLIAAYAPTASEAGVGSALGVAMFNGGFLDNRAGGSILAEGLSATALIFSRGHLNDPGVAGIRNAGRIEAYSIGGANESIAILTAALTVEIMRVENSGLIRADVAYRSVSELGYSPPQQPADEIVNFAGGEIYGMIDTRLGHDSLVNRGFVRGELRMGEGDDLVDSVGGVLEGKAVMGWGEDSFAGGDSDDAVLGGRDDDWLNGGGGRDLLLGGVGGDILIGGAGNDGLYGEYGDDSIVTEGGDLVDAGEGEDVIVVGDLSFASIHGGAGSDVDRLVLAIGADSLDLTGVRASGRVQDIELIETLGQQRLVLRVGDALGLTGGETTLLLVTTATDTIELIGSWAEGSGIPIDGNVFRTFVGGGELVLVGGAGTVSIAGAPSAPAGGLDPVAAGAAAPLPGLVPGVDLSSATTILDNYELHDDELVQSHEIWRSEGGQPVIAPDSIQHSLINHGLIESSGPGNGGAKVAMIGSMDRIENYGTMRASATGGHYAQVVDTDRWGAVTNYGLIDARTEGGRATGVAVRGSWWDDVNFLNHGTITATTNGTAAALGAEVSQDAAAFNYGTILATGGDGTVGIKVTDQRHFANYGMIEASLAAGASGTTTGMFYLASFWGSTFVNYGTIRGSKAIDSGGGIGFPGMAAFYNEGRIEGSVQLDNGRSVFDNRGFVVGEVRLGTADNLWFGANGVLQGSLFAGDGSDMLVGGGSPDSLRGEGGDDYLLGGRGADQLSGGEGRDYFVYTDALQSTASFFDTLTDFVSGTDRIDLTALGVQSVSIQPDAGFSMLNAVTAGGATLVVRVNGALSQSDLILAAAPAIVGTSGADRLVATAGGSVVDGGAGNDALIGSAGNDRLDGGDGADVMWGGEGDDVYVVTDGDIVWELGGHGIDLAERHTAGFFTLADNVENATLFAAGGVTGNAVANLLRGSAGNDSLTGAEGDDTLIGAAGADILTGLEGADHFVYLAAGDSTAAAIDQIQEFESGVDKIDLTALSPTSFSWSQQHDPILNTPYNLVTVQTPAGIVQLRVYGALAIEDFLADPDRQLTGTAGDDILTGGTGNDTLTGGIGADSLNGAGGTDTASYADNHGGVFADLRAGRGYGNAAEGDTYSDIENLIGSDFADFLIGNDGANRLEGRGGDDALVGGIGADALVGGAGIDTAGYDDNWGAVFVNLNIGQGFGNAAQGDTYQGIENVLGTAFADFIIGDGAANRLDGAAGADILVGSVGADALVGGAGIDTASYEDNWGAVFVNLTLGQGFGNAAQGDTYDGIENLTGSIFGDFFIGDNGVNRLDGGAGGDVLVGSVGADHLIGGGGSDTASYEDNWGAVSANLSVGQGFGNAAQGDTYDGIENLRGSIFNDFLIGDAGANVLAGGRGNDGLVGGAGADMFLFDAALGDNIDTLFDFVSGTDKILLDDAVFEGLGLGALAAGAFVVGTAAADGDDRIIYNQAAGTLLFDADGSGAIAAVQFATLQGAPVLTASDFTLI
jgi:Ca2+-binding RTX toxin-like protein